MGSGQGFGSPIHLAVRFFGSLVPVGPRPVSQRWAESSLTPAETKLFNSMSGADRRHAIGVARRASALALSNAPDPAGDGLLAREVVAAALLHDGGKVESGLGTIGRVVATLAAMLFGRARLVERARRPEQGSERSLGTRIGLYLMHDRLGASLLEKAGSGDLTVRWAGEHHLPEDRWTVEPNLGRALKQADGD